MPTPIVSLVLRCNTEAPRRARAALDGIPEIAPVCDDAKLVATELVTNAVLHSGATSDDLIMMSVSLGESCLKIAVHDPGRSLQTPRTIPNSDPAQGGLGLRLVGMLAQRWATERPDGCLVWAELAVPA